MLFERQKGNNMLHSTYSPRIGVKAQSIDVRSIVVAFAASTSVAMVFSLLLTQLFLRGGI